MPIGKFEVAGKTAFISGGGRGLRVNAVAPAYVNTVMSRAGFGEPALGPIWMESTPMRRPAEPEEIATAILFLAGDAASAIAGSVVVADCGYTIW